MNFAPRSKTQVLQGQQGQVRDRPYKTSDGKREGDSVKSDLILNGALTKHLTRGDE